ncbi:hypothetical protein F8568_045220 [Actinomadura sp. LD22]|uniref:Uncharacterized protein n=1 Tax=Actinomadura physcomitrii TaxID=2650748 RepID=A0A6I4MQW6_9ACTN|nr:hypothetical protein [Actinomadura physcomitrii]MWA07410.1 hypothetical protein [Actinomadura physcomitrii]
MTTTTAPTLADALEAMARAELDEDAPVPAITRAVEALTPHLDAERRDLWWWELKRCLTRADDAQGGPAWDETGVDWPERAAEALDVLTGTAN